MRNAMNEVLRDWYVGDCQAGVERWNKRSSSATACPTACLPDRKFNRGIGMFSSLHFDPTGQPLRRGMGAPEARVAAVAGGQGVPAQHHGDAGLRAGQVRQLHRAAARGINRMPIDFEYVRDGGRPTAIEEGSETSNVTGCGIDSRLCEAGDDGYDARDGDSHASSS